MCEKGGGGGRWHRWFQSSERTNSKKSRNEGRKNSVDSYDADVMRRATCLMFASKVYTLSKFNIWPRSNSDTDVVSIVDNCKRASYLGNMFVKRGMVREYHNEKPRLVAMRSHT